MNWEIFAMYLIPMITDVVKNIENFFHGHSGAVKKTAALAMVGDALNIYQSASIVDSRLPSISTSGLQTSIGQVVDASVAIYNDLGVFHHATKHPVAAPTPPPALKTTTVGVK